MDYAYRIPENDRARIISKEAEGSEDDPMGLKAEMEELFETWKNSGGPNPGDEIEKALFEAWPNLINALNVDVDGMSDPAISRAIVMVNGKQKESFVPAMGAAASGLLTRAMPFLGKGMGIGTGMQAGEGFIKNLIPGLGQEGTPGPPIVQDPRDTYLGRVTIQDDPFFLHAGVDNQHIDEDTFSLYAKTDAQVEGFRAQVVNALNAWANSGTIPPEQNADWWQKMNSAKRTEVTLAELALLMASIPEEFHSAAQMAPVQPLDEGGATDSGFPLMPDPQAMPDAPFGDPQPPSADLSARQRETPGQLLPGAFSSVVKEANNLALADYDFLVDLGFDPREAKWEKKSGPDKQMRMLLKHLESSGFNLRLTSKGHTLVTHPESRATVTLIAKSDGRGKNLQNSLSDLKRQFGELFLPPSKLSVAPQNIPSPSLAMPQPVPQTPKSPTQVELEQLIIQYQSMGMDEETARQMAMQQLSMQQNMGVPADPNNPVGPSTPAQDPQPEHEHNLPSARTANYDAVKYYDLHKRLRDDEELDSTQRDALKQQLLKMNDEDLHWHIKSVEDLEDATAEELGISKSDAYLLNEQNEDNRKERHNEILDKWPVVSSFKDVEGQLLAPGTLYKMTTNEYDVPDYVRVLETQPDLVVQINNGKGGVEMKIADTTKRAYKFERVSSSSFSVREQQDYINEEGVARNLDKLNLTNSHYEQEFPDFYSSIEELRSGPLSSALLLADNADHLLFI